jgi:hypothetical protein
MPIISMSGAAHALEKCRPRAFACLQKTFNIEVFVDTVRSAIATSRVRAPDSVLTDTAPRCLSHAVILLFGYVVSSTRRLAELRLKSSCSLRHEHVDMSDEFNPSNPNPRHNRDPASCTCNGVSRANGLPACPCAVVTSGRDFARPLLPCCP